MPAPVPCLKDRVRAGGPSACGGFQNQESEPQGFQPTFLPEGMFELTLPDEVGPGQSGKGRLKLTDQAVASSFEKSFTIEVTGNETDRFTVPVKRT